MCYLTREVSQREQVASEAIMIMHKGVGVSGRVQVAINLRVLECRDGHGDEGGYSDGAVCCIAAQWFFCGVADVVMC